MANKRASLIVDDDAELREALVEQLALHEEFEAIAVDSGTKGVQAAKNGQIDLVIMDVGLPDVDGREAVRILRKNGFKAPVIMLTGHHSDLRCCWRASGRNFGSTRPVKMLYSLLGPIRSDQVRNCCSAQRAARYGLRRRKRPFFVIFTGPDRNWSRARLCYRKYGVTIQA